MKSHYSQDYIDDVLVRFAYHSTGIEGNTLTLRDTQRILEGHVLPSSGDHSLRELYEVDNHRRAFDQQEPEQDLKQLSAQVLNKSYQGLQQQIKQATDPQQKSELKNQLHEVHQEISNRAQKQLQDFVRQNPKIKQPDPESYQSLKR